MKSNLFIIIFIIAVYAGVLNLYQSIDVNNAIVTSNPCPNDVSYDCVARALFEIWPMNMDSDEEFKAHARQYMQLFSDVQDRELLEDLIEKFDNAKEHKVQWLLSLGRDREARKLYDSYASGEGAPVYFHTMKGDLEAALGFYKRLLERPAPPMMTPSGMLIVTFDAYKPRTVIMLSLFEALMETRAFDKALELLVIHQSYVSDYEFDTRGTVWRIFSNKYRFGYLDKQNLCQIVAKRRYVESYLQYRCYGLGVIFQNPSAYNNIAFGMAYNRDYKAIDRYLKNFENMKYRAQLYKMSEYLFLLGVVDKANDYADQAKLDLEAHYEDLKDERGYKNYGCQMQQLAGKLLMLERFKEAFAIMDEHTCVKSYYGAMTYYKKSVLLDKETFLRVYPHFERYFEAEPWRLRSFLQYRLMHGTLSPQDIMQLDEREYDPLQMFSYIEKFEIFSPEERQEVKNYLWRSHFDKCSEDNAYIPSCYGRFLKQAF